MPPPKGSYNAKRFHEDSIALTRRALADVLTTTARSGVVFKNISTLADYVSTKCGQTPGNLRRSKTYRAMLEVHLSTQRGGSGVISDYTRDLGILKAKLLSSQLAASNATKDKKRLENYIASRLSIIEVPNDRNSSPVATKADLVTRDYREAFECTAEALLKVINHAEIFEIDKKRKEINDKSARPGSENIVSPNHARHFIEWLSKK